MKSQIEAILEILHSQEYTIIEEYIQGCYRDGFIGALYDWQGQDIPLIIPINQEQVVKALQLDSKISKDLYKSQGEDVTTLKSLLQKKSVENIFIFDVCRYGKKYK